MSKVSKIEKLACDTAKSIGLVPFYLTDENILEISKYKNPDHHNYGVEYLGAVTPIEVKEKRKTVLKFLFQGNRFDSLKDAVNTIIEYNKTLMFPPECYRKSLRTMHKVGLMINWYMENILGFKANEDCRGLTKKFYRPDIYGAKRFKIDITLDQPWDYKGDNGFSGYISYGINNSSCIIKKFQSLETFMQGVCSIVEPVLLIECEKSISFFDKSNKIEKDYNAELLTMYKGLNFNTENVRSMLKDRLQSALKRIEEQEKEELNNNNGKSEEKDSLQNRKESCYNSEVIT